MLKDYIYLFIYIVRVLTLVKTSLSSQILLQPAENWDFKHAIQRSENLCLELRLPMEARYSGTRL